MPTSDCAGQGRSVRAGRFGVDRDCYRQSGHRRRPRRGRMPPTNLELLFVDWLDAVMYEMATRGIVIRLFRSSHEGPVLTGILHGL
jgi:hypothetical protein